MKKSLKLALKLAAVASSIAILSACGGGDSDVIIVTDHAFLSVDNLNVGNGTVCVEDIFLEASSSQGQQVAQDLIDYYGIYDFGLRPLNNAYSAPTYCGGPTSNYVPAPGIIISANDYYNVIVPSVTSRR
jgi:hypothetical protein